MDALAGTTELEAVNAMLAGVGEAPVSSLPSSLPNVVAATTLLRDVTRQTLSKGWSFNTEHAYQVAPAGTLAWLDTDGVTTTLNVFTPPSGLLKADPAKVPGQEALDLTIRQARRYLSPAQPLVFYDRAGNRDGLEQSKFPYLYITPVWYVAFDYLPEEARHFIKIRSARQYAERIVGSSERSGFLLKDEVEALRQLQESYGMEDDYNILNNAEMSRFTGYRPKWFGTSSDPRKTAGPA